VVPSTPQTSSRLVRAAAAERADLVRHREKLHTARTSLREELARIEVSLREVDYRDALLARLAGDDLLPAPAMRDAQPAPDGGQADEGEVIRGPEVRKAAVRVLLDQPDRPEALHYRQWHELVVRAGYRVAGKDPVAVFLTQLSRSPVIARSTQNGVYALDLDASARLRRQLDDLHREMRTLASTPDGLADLAAIRARRKELTAEVARLERALEEADELLGDADGPPRAAAH
jgi:hypothetical protein